MALAEGVIESLLNLTKRPHQHEYLLNSTFNCSNCKIVTFTTVKRNRTDLEPSCKILPLRYKN